MYVDRKFNLSTERSGRANYSEKNCRNLRRMVYDFNIRVRKTIVIHLIHHHDNITPWYSVYCILIVK